MLRAESRQYGKRGIRYFFVERRAWFAGEIFFSASLRASRKSVLVIRSLASNGRGIIFTTGFLPHVFFNHFLNSSAR